MKLRRIQSGLACLLVLGVVSAWAISRSAFPQARVLDGATVNMAIAHDQSERIDGRVAPPDEAADDAKMQQPQAPIVPPVITVPVPAVMK